MRIIGTMLILAAVALTGCVGKGGDYKPVVRTGEVLDYKVSVLNTVQARTPEGKDIVTKIIKIYSEADPKGQVFYDRDGKIYSGAEWLNHIHKGKLDAIKAKKK